jgi:predicted acetyltransferase
VTVEIRPIGPDEVDPWIRSLHVPFLAKADNDGVAHWVDHLEIGRTWVAADAGRFVGTSCVFTRDVTLPGVPGGLAPTVPLTAVSGVGVHTTHRRRGILSRMMGTMMSDAIDRGEPIAGLLASEAAIYGQFGFGWATSTVELSLPRRTTHLTHDAPALDLVLCGAKEAESRLPKLFDRFRLQRSGQVDRNPAYWKNVVADPKSMRPTGTSERFFAVCDDGYVAYRPSNHWDSGNPNVLHLDELFGVSPDAEAALWQYLLSVDLVDTIVAGRPVDEPIRWRLADPRSLAVTGLKDMLWIRVLDVPTALTARRYRTEGRLVLEVEPAPTSVDKHGEARPDPAAGRWVLEVGPDGSSCRSARAGERQELRLGVSELGAALLGGQDLRSRASAARVAELVPGALERADAIFATTPAPFSSTGF